MSTQIERLSTALADRYRIERELGAGGMATVYLAEDLKHDRRVAVKVLRPELAAVLGSERFLNEIKVTANLQHPNILALYDSGEADTLLYYVMPLFEGDTLRDKLDREKQLSVDETVSIATSVAAALDYAHDQGVVHRDIKPENILLQRGQAVVADFGIALAVSQAGGSRLTETGLSLGTPHYMSPEQATGDRELDARSDVYSLGAMAYEMLTGDPPHNANSVQAVVAKILTEAPSPITTARSLVPPNVDAAVQQALAKSPADRFSSAGQFVAALTNPSFTLPTTQVAVTAPAGRDWKHRLAVPALALAALLLVSNGWMLMRGVTPEPVTRYQVDFPADARIAPNEWSRIAVSPDGSLLVYTGPDDRLFVRRRDQLTATELPGTDGAFNPFFSRDGTRVGFMAGPPGNAMIKVVSLVGGPPMTVTDSSVGGPGASWGYDGYIYYDASGVGPLRRVPETGGPSEIISALDTLQGERQHVWPDALPNGRGVLMGVNRGGPGQQAGETDDIAVLDLASGKHRPLLRGVYARYAASGHILYVTYDGFLMAVGFDQHRMELTSPPVPLADGIAIRGGGGGVDLAISESGTLWYATGTSAGAERQVVWVTLDGVATEVDAGWIGDFRALAISPDGSRLAVEQQGDDGRHIWVKQLDRARGPSTKLTFDDFNRNPAWHPDGDRLLFTSGASGIVRMTRSDGSTQPEPLLQEDYAISEAAWSPDGRWIVAQSGPPRTIHGLRVDADSTSRPLVVKGPSDRMPAVSPNGRWLAYVSNRSGVYEVYVQPFPDTGAWLRQVSNGGGWEPRWSHDGTRLFFMNGASAGELELVEILPSATFTTGDHRVLFPLTGIVDYDVAPDDRRFVMIREPGADRPGTMVVVENFFEELKVRVGH